MLFSWLYYSGHPDGASCLHRISSGSRVVTGVPDKADQHLGTHHDSTNARGVGGLAATMTQQMQLQQDRTLEVMQNGQRDMAVKMNELNMDNPQKIIAINHENQASLPAAVKPGSCQMHNVVQ